MRYWKYLGDHSLNGQLPTNKIVDDEWFKWHYYVHAEKWNPRHDWKEVTLEIYLNQL